MSIDEAVRLKIEQTLKQKNVVDEEKAVDTAKDEARKIYEMFNKEIDEVKANVQKISDRLDRLWDQIFTAKPVKTGFWSKLAFWRR